MITNCCQTLKVANEESPMNSATEEQPVFIQDFLEQQLLKEVIKVTRHEYQVVVLTLMDRFFSYYS